MTDPETVGDVLAEMRKDYCVQTPDNSHARGHSDASGYWADRIERAMAASAVPVAWLVTFRRADNSAIDRLLIHAREDAEKQVCAELIVGVSPLYAHAPPAVPVESIRCGVSQCGMTYARMPKDGRCHACGATLQHAPPPASVPDVIESIAAGWDDCYFDDDMPRRSIGDRIRADAKRLLATTPEESP